MLVGSYSVQPSLQIQHRLVLLPPQIRKCGLWHLTPISMFVTIDWPVLSSFQRLSSFPFHVRFLNPLLFNHSSVWYPYLARTPPAVWLPVNLTKDWQDSDLLFNLMLHPHSRRDLGISATAANQLTKNSTHAFAETSLLFQDVRAAILNLQTQINLVWEKIQLLETKILSLCHANFTHICVTPYRRRQHCNDYKNLSDCI